MIKTLQNILQKPSCVLVACQPKSASTFTANVLSALPGCRHVRLVPGYDRREQELCEQRIKRYRFRPSRHLIAQAHLRHSAPTEGLIARHDMRVIVLVRDPFDTVASLRDHIRDEGGRFPFAHFDENDRKMPDAALELAIARLVMPWVLNFRLSWENHPTALHISYEDIAGNPPAALSRMAAHAGIPAPLDLVETLCARMRAPASRFNIGIQGRGQSISPKARGAIEELASLYSAPHRQDSEVLKAFMANPHQPQPKPQ